VELELRYGGQIHQPIRSRELKPRKDLRVALERSVRRRRLVQGREPGWYAFDDDHDPVLGPFNLDEECVEAIKSLAVPPLPRPRPASAKADKELD
jgi:hypothetical protein